MNPTDLLRNLFIMAFADGEISPEELHLLAEHRDRWGMSKAQFEATLREAESPSARLQLPEDRDDRRQLLSDMAAVMAADGRFTNLEMNVFALAAVRLEIAGEELDEILDELSYDDDLIIEDSEISEGSDEG